MNVRRNEAIEPNLLRIILCQIDSVLNQNHTSHNTGKLTRFCMQKIARSVQCPTIMLNTLSDGHGISQN